MRLNTRMFSNVWSDTQNESRVNIDYCMRRTFDSETGRGGACLPTVACLTRLSLNIKSALELRWSPMTGSAEGIRSSGAI